jgi:dCTP deaminase
MSLLPDSELLQHIVVTPPAIPYVEGLEVPQDPYSAKSPVQASSVDLHIGNIYLPGRGENENGGAGNPMFDHLPADIAGFGFPPSGVSFKGLLMTNPGHVDPGYVGVMRFTVINMAKEKYRLTRGKPIVTLLLFRLSAASHRDWGQRHPEGSSLPEQASVDRLSRDFVDVERRATEIARRESKKVSGLVSGSLAVLTAFLGLVGSGHLIHNAAIDDLTRRQEMVEYDMKNRVDIERKLLEFDKRLTLMETKGTLPKPGKIDNRNSQ